jgi:hypothetical protein
LFLAGICHTNNGVYRGPLLPVEEIEKTVKIGFTNRFDVNPVATMQIASKIEMAVSVRSIMPHEFKSA